MWWLHHLLYMAGSYHAATVTRQNSAGVLKLMGEVSECDDGYNVGVLIYQQAF